MFQPLVACLAQMESDHPILYKVYPELMRLKVELEDRYRGKAIADQVKEIFECRLMSLQSKLFSS